MKNFIILIIFSFSLSLFSGDELFPFGMNRTVYEYHDTLTKNGEYQQKYKTTMNLCAQAGIKWWRAQYAFRWCNVQPDNWDEDKWDFETEDSLVKWCGERGLHLLPSIGYTAGWASHPEAEPLSWENRYRYPPDPDHWDDYQDYVDTLVERYDGDGINDMPGLENLTPIKYWQFSNEPYGGYFLGTPDQYVEMYDYTWTALKSADSTAKIVGLCMTSDEGTFEWKYYDTTNYEEPVGDTILEFKGKFDTKEYVNWEEAVKDLIESIGLDSIDVVSHHIYNNTPNFMKYTRELDSILKANTGGKGKPIWITETGIQNADPVRAERGRKDYIKTNTSCVTYSCDSGEVFWDTVWAMWAWKEPDIIRIDTFLKIEDTVVLYNRKQNAHDIIIYNGGPLMYKDTVTALAIDDTLTVFDCWAEEIGRAHNPDSQATRYEGLLDSVINTPDFLNNLKVFFFCADNTIHKRYYPPIIRFGNIEYTVYKPPEYLRSRLPDVTSVIDPNDDPYPAYYTIQNHILKPGNQIIPMTMIDTNETKTYQAMDSISANDFRIKGNGSNGGKVAMEAGNKISLKPGFRVEEGGYFYAATNPLYGGGGGGMSSMKRSKPKKIKTPKKDEPTDSIPKVFSCSQNYPNPFATSTIIKYGLPKDVAVQLDIYNLIGQRIQTLVNAKQSAGYKQVSWDGKTSVGTQAPRGIYFYTFKAGDFEKKRKMILLK